MSFKTILKVLFSILVFGVSRPEVQAQEPHLHDHEHKHDGKHDHFHKNEIGLSIAPVFFQGESDVHLGLHAHYVHRLGESRFGTGVGLEYIPGDALHQTYSALFQYSPTYQLHLVVAPGVAIEGEHDHEEEHEEDHEEEGEEIERVVFAIHLEAVYEFHVSFFDIGPSVEFAWDPNDIHYAVGVHVGIPF